MVYIYKKKKQLVFKTKQKVKFQFMWTENLALNKIIGFSLKSLLISMKFQCRKGASSSWISFKATSLDWSLQIGARIDLQEQRLEIARIGSELFDFLTFYSPGT